MVIECCVCKRMRADGRWVHRDDPGPADADVSHGYCPECARKAFKEIQLLHAKPMVAGHS